jgi:hypothetical protein
MYQRGKLGPLTRVLSNHGKPATQASIITGPISGYCVRETSKIRHKTPLEDQTAHHAHNYICIGTVRERIRERIKDHRRYPRVPTCLNAVRLQKALHLPTRLTLGPIQSST